MHGERFGEEARKGDAARGAGVCAIAEAQRGERFLGEHAAAARKPEQPQIGRRAGERRLGLVVKLGDEPGACAFEAR